MILQQSQMTLFEESDVSTFSAEDFRAKLSALREKDEVFQILEELSFLRLHGSHLFSDLAFYSLKTSKDYSITKEGLRLKQSSERWMSLGMMWNSRVLTVKDTSPKIESGFILSDILEENVPQTDSKSGKISLAGTTHVENNVSLHTRERTFYTDGVMSCLTATDYKSPKQIVVGNVNPSKRGMNGSVYNSNGLSPTLTTNNGEGNKIVLPVLTPDRLKNRQNGRRFKSNEEDMFTVTAQDRHGIMVMGNLESNFRQGSSVLDIDGISTTLTTMSGGGQEPKIAIKESTKKGYAEATVGDSINLSFPDSEFRRGRVGKDIANTLLTNDQQGILTEDFQIRKLTPMECWRLQAFPDWAFLAAKFGSKEIAFDILNRQLNHYDCEYEPTMSNSQLYKQAGNSVTTLVIYEIAKHFK